MYNFLVVKLFYHLPNVLHQTHYRVKLLNEISFCLEVLAKWFLFILRTEKQSAWPFQIFHFCVITRSAFWMVESISRNVRHSFCLLVPSATFIGGIIKVKKNYVKNIHILFLLIFLGGRVEEFWWY